MKVKEGDKLICQKPKLRFFKSDPEPNFTDGKIYEVKTIMIGNPKGGKPFETLVIYEDNNTIRFLNNDEILPDTSLGKILIGIKELRKRKLKKLNGIKNYEK